MKHGKLIDTVAGIAPKGFWEGLLVTYRVYRARPVVIRGVQGTTFVMTEQVEKDGETVIKRVQVQGTTCEELSDRMDSARLQLGETDCKPICLSL